jgi:hypothetical protein
MQSAYQSQPEPWLETAQDHFDQLHTPAHGTTLLWEREGPGRRWTKLTPDNLGVAQILASQNGGPERFIGVNEFHSWRVVAQLKSLRALYVDIDGCTDLNWCLEGVANAQLPTPTLAVYSGRGIHLYWVIDPVGSKALPVWQRLQNEVGKRLVAQGIPVDPAAKDSARMLRLIGSKHGNGELVRGRVLKPWKWTLHGLADEILGFREASTASVHDLGAARVRKSRSIPRSASSSIYSRWHLVYKDLQTIAEHHFLGGIPEGHRERWLFLYGVALSWFAEPATLATELQGIVRQATPNLSASDVAKALAPNLTRAEAARAGETITYAGIEVDPRYRFKRETLYTWLQPVIPDSLLPELRAIIPNALAEKRKGERDASRSEDHYTGTGVKASNEMRRAEARILVAQGMSIAAVARQVGVAYATAFGWVKKE